MDRCPERRLPVLLALGLGLGGVACSARVQHGLDERQANEIQSVLLERGFRARKAVEDVRNRFLVLFEWAWAYLSWQRGARLITHPWKPRA